MSKHGALPRHKQPQRNPSQLCRRDSPGRAFTICQKDPKGVKKCQGECKGTPIPLDLRQSIKLLPNEIYTSPPSARLAARAATSWLKTQNISKHTSHAIPNGHFPHPPNTPYAKSCHPPSATRLGENRLARELGKLRRGGALQPRLWRQRGAHRRTPTPRLPAVVGSLTGERIAGAVMWWGAVRQW